MFFQDPYLNKITCMDPFHKKIYHFQEIVISKEQNTKRASRTFLFGQSLFQKIATRLKDHSLLNSPIIIPRYGFHFRSTDLTDKPHS